jgi:hypothetical protein
VDTAKAALVDIERTEMSNVDFEVIATRPAKAGKASPLRDVNEAILATAVNGGAVKIAKP